MAERTRVILRNAVRRPVELHLSGGVVVLVPGETFELAEPSAMCDALERRGVLTRHVVPASESGVAAIEALQATGTRTDRRSAPRRTPAGAPKKSTGVRQVKGDSE